MVELFSRILKLRGELHLTRKEFAQATGIGTRSVQYYEEGERFPNAEWLIKVVQMYKVSPAYLLLGQGPMFMGAEAESADLVPRAELEKVRAELAKTSASFVKAFDELMEEREARIALEQELARLKKEPEPDRVKDEHHAIFHEKVPPDLVNEAGSAAKGLRLKER